MKFRCAPSLRPHARFAAFAFGLWLYYVLCFVAHPASAIMHGRFIDPDNSMYLSETLNWLHGQGWYDRIEHRLNPPAGVPIHFSRLMELPFAAVILPLQPFIGSIGAATVAAATVPLFLLLALFFAFRFQARFFIARPRAYLAPLAAFFAQNMTFVFMPGQAGHHGFIALLITLATAGASMMLVKPQADKWAIFTGVTLALALAIALESLPWLLLIAFVIGVFAVLRGGTMARAAGIFGLTLALTGTALLTIYKPQAEWLDMDLVAFSSTYILLLFGIAACCGTTWFARRRAFEWRLAATGFIACLTGGVFLASFPDLLTGPYGAVDATLNKFMLPNISEAIPMIKRAGVYDFYLYFLPWPLLSLGVCAWQCAAASPRRRQLWFLFAVLQAAAAALCAFYQARFASYSQLFGVVPLAFLMDWGLRRATNKYLKPIWFAVPALLMVALPAILYDDPPLSILLFPMQSYTPGCDVRHAAEVLSAPPYYEGKPQLILNSLDEGPSLLLLTPHNVMAGPYHEDVDGNLDVAKFFRTADMDEAQSIAHRRGVNYVLLCRNIEAAYLTSNIGETDYTSGYIRMPLPAPLSFQLITLHPPDWLQPVDLGTSDVLLFRVVPTSVL